MPSAISHGRNKNQPIGTNGEAIESFKGAMSIHDADVHNVPINEHFHRHTGTITTLAVASSKGAISITVADGTDFAENDDIQIENGVIEVTFPRITVKNGNVLTLDRPLDNAFSIDDKVEKITYDMCVNGTLAAPVSFRVIPDRNQVWHIETFTISLTHSTQGADELFGDQIALKNGVVLRAYNGATATYRTLANWKNNASIKLDTGTTNPYADKAGSAKYGTLLNGQIKLRSGAVPFLDGSAGSYLEVLVQDSLSGLDSFTMKAVGHIVGL